MTDLLQKRPMSRYERAIVAIACLLMLFVVQIALVLPWFLAVAIPGQ